MDTTIKTLCRYPGFFGKINSHWFVLVLVLLLGLSGCAGAKRNMSNALESDMESYRGALRWLAPEKALKHHKSRNGKRKTLPLDNLRQVKVTHVKLDVIDADLEKGSAIIQGGIDYYQQDRPVLKKISFTQNWWYDPESTRWYIESDFPLSRTN